MSFRLVLISLTFFMFLGITTNSQAANRYWVAASASNWNNSANWSTSSGGAGGASIPGNSDLAIFDGSSVFDCNLAINIDVQGMLILSGYTGTITQAAGITITLGTSGWDQSDGTFTGGDSQIDVNRNFVLSGGIFNSTSGTLFIGGTQGGNSTIYSQTAGTFNANSGTVHFDPFRNSCANTTYTIDVLASTEFYNLVLDGSQSCGQSARFNSGTSDTIAATNLITHQNGYVNGNWEVLNDFEVTNSADGGLGKFIFNGSGTQEYTSSSGAVRTAILEINTSGIVQPAIGTTDISSQGLILNSGTFVSASGTLDIGGTYAANTILFEHVGGTFDANSGIVEFTPFRNSCANTFYDIDVLTSTEFYDVQFNGTQSCGRSANFRTSAGDTIDISNDLSHINGSLSAQAEVQNNLIVSSSADGGLGEVIFNGAGAQEYSVSGTGIRSSFLTIDKSAGTVSPALGTTNLLIQGLKIVSGTFQAPSDTLTIGGTYTSSFTLFEHLGGTFDANNGTLELDPFRNSCGATTYTLDVLNSSQFFNLLINGTQSCGQSARFTTAASDTVDVMNDLIHNNGYINGIWEIKNNLDISTSADGGLGEIIFNGSGAQEYSINGASRSCRITVDKPAGTVSSALGNTDLTVQALKIVSGNFQAPSGTLTLGGTFTSSVTIFEHSGGTFDANNGTLELDPFRNSCGNTTYTLDVITSTQFYDVLINGSQSCGRSALFSTAVSDSIDILNDLIHNNGYVNGIWEVKNDLNITSSADGGLGEIIFNGTGNQEYSTTGANLRSCRLTVDKPSGNVSPAIGNTALAIQGFKLVNGNFQAPSGTFEIGGTFVSNFTLFQHLGGTFDANFGTVEFDPFRNTCAATTYTIDVLQSTEFYDVLINGTQGCGQSARFTTGASDTVNATNDFQHNNGYINGLWEVKNDLIISSSSDGGLGKIIFNGAGSQEYDVSSAGIRTCIIVVDKSAGDVSAAVGTTDFSMQGFELSSGTFNAPTGTMLIGGTFTNNATIFNHSGGVFNANSGLVEFDPFRNTCAATTYTIDVLQSTQFFDVEINGSQGCGQFARFNTGSLDSVDVQNNFTHNNGYINGIWTVLGNFFLTSSADGGLGEIIFYGSSDQEYDVSSGAIRTCEIIVDKSAGSVSPGAGTTDLSSQGFHLANGTFNAPTGTFSIGGTFGASTTIFEHSGGSFNAGSGTVEFDPFRNTCAFTSYTIDLIPVTEFNSLIFNGSQGCGQSATMTLATTDTVKISSNLTLNNGRVNGPPMFVSGNVDVNSSFDGGNSPLVFTGPNAQTWDLTSATARFDGNVIFDKASNDVTLLSDCQLDNSGGSQVISFYRGNLISTSTELFIIGNDVTVDTVSDVSYVSGPVRKIGNDAFEFPTGKGGSYAPISMSAPGAISDHFTAEYFDSDPDPLFSTASILAPIDSVNRREYWTLDRTNGTAAVFVTLHFDIRRNMIDTINDVAIARWDTATSQWEGINVGAAGTTTSGTITSNAPVSNFSPFTFASIPGVFPLPVTLLHFNAIKRDDHVQIFWSTSPIGKTEFSLEKSNSGIDFKEIFNVISEEGPEVFQTFEHRDFDIEKNMYYRLKETLEDGTVSYSRILYIEFSFESEFQVAVLGNPVQNHQLNLELNGVENDEVLIQIFDTRGNQIIQSKSNLLEGQNQMHTTNLPYEISSGAYILRVLSGQNMQIFNILVE